VKKIRIDCFKAYDVRGRVPDELNEDIAYRIGRAYAAFTGARRVAVGHDIRQSSPAIRDALTRGLTDAGVQVLDIGCGGTEMVYFATFHEKLDGGIMVTASHNPPDYNGLKLVREQARPISADTGLVEIRALAEAGLFEDAGAKGSISRLGITPAYIRHLLGYVDVAALSPLKIVVNAGNGGAGPIIDLLEPHLPFEFIKLQHEPDGSFPNGVPNPLLPENRAVTQAAVLEHGADLGVAWDGDFDRCFPFDEQGQFIEGYYIVGLLAKAVLAREPGAKIVHDPRLTWNSIEMITELGGVPVQSKSGHAFMKDALRKVDAAYGGEMSAHHFFREFAYCDSGMIPWLLVAQIMAAEGKPLSALVGERMARYPVSGEINRRVRDVPGLLARIEQVYTAQGAHFDRTDGLGVELERWRFNIRSSNTEPLVRLNVESRADPALLQAKSEEVLALIGEFE
jgi:phosphomannomutase